MRISCVPCLGSQPWDKAQPSEQKGTRWTGGQGRNRGHSPGLCSLGPKNLCSWKLWGVHAPECVHVCVICPNVRVCACMCVHMCAESCVNRQAQQGCNDSGLRAVEEEAHILRSESALPPGQQPASLCHSLLMPGGPSAGSTLCHLLPTHTHQQLSAGPAEPHRTSTSVPRNTPTVWRQATGCEAVCQRHSVKSLPPKCARNSPVQQGQSRHLAKDRQRT